MCGRMHTHVDSHSLAIANFQVNLDQSFGRLIAQANPCTLCALTPAAGVGGKWAPAAGRCRWGFGTGSRYVLVVVGHRQPVLVAIRHW